MHSPAAQDDLKNRLARVLGNFPEVAAAYLFGAQAEGQARPDSDLDLALVVKQPLGLRKLEILAALTAEGLDKLTEYLRFLERMQAYSQEAFLSEPEH